ncbi:hypothetical protein H5410_004205 [Solanum commersonii]|uniref:Uncharacterized protein n=1 Tax=Solanum commersonii TaxID=4109 RepID=A0A9J6B726_SOLCO|nr:hypothetical protein H5410_004205 [Solanum commersonii]
MFPLWINKKLNLRKLWFLPIQGYVFMSSFSQLTRVCVVHPIEFFYVFASHLNYLFSSCNCFLWYVEKRNKLSQSGNSTNVRYGRKIKNIEPSGGDESNMENNGRRKSSPETCECINNKPFIEEISHDDDLLEEETDPNVVILDKESDHDVIIIVEEEKEEEKSDPDVVIIVKADPMLNSIDVVVSSTISMCRKTNISKDLPDTTSYF